MAAAPARSSGVYFVDNSGASCSDTGPGTEAQPYCTISAALLAHHGASTTIYVKPGVYREQVTVPLAGSAANPLVIQAFGGTATVEAADDVSGPANWVQYSGDVYLDASVDWAPSQAFLDGARLSPSIADPAFLPAHSYNWVVGQGMYVNAGGDNPGTHSVLATRRPYGFLAAARSYLVIDGFTVLHAGDRGVQLNNACSNVTITHNTVTWSYKYGIQAVAGSNLLIDSNTVSESGDHGIMFLNGVTSSTVQNNLSFDNARPDVRAANGINLFNCPGNVILGNRAHHNQDTGIQVEAGSDNCLLLQNRSWQNGDHGFDNINSAGTVHLGDDAFGNYKDGFSIEGTATGTTLYNCIATDNGLASHEFDLWVNPASTAGFVSNNNVFWNSTPQPPVKYIATQYPTLAAYSAVSGQDSSSLQVDPQFTNPWAGDFELVKGSPAIDAANSDVANWPASDALGRARIDDYSVLDSGVGPVTYADRGALEFQNDRVVIRPLASMLITPPIGTAPLDVAVDASGSSDADGSIVSYYFDFGDGTTVGPQASPYTTHTYAAGNWTARLIATDNDGAAQQATILLFVNPATPQNLALNSSFEQDLTGWDAFGAASLLRVAGGEDGDWSAQMTATGATKASFGINDHADWVRSVPAEGLEYQFNAWVMSSSSTGQAELSINEYVLATGEFVKSAASTRVPLTPAWQLLTMNYVVQRRGTTLDFSVRDFPLALGEVFQADNISVYNLGLTTLSAGGLQSLANLAPMLYPSPLKTSATLRFATSRPGRLKVEILDLAGRRVRRLLDQDQAAAGLHQLSVERASGADGARLDPGIYFYRIAASEGTRSGRFVVLR
ncbi:MAG: right-handed parallel beta-helix repeat-containing protein [Candidatus Eiseniibacteriota bacterium]